MFWKHKSEAEGGRRAGEATRSTQEPMASRLLVPVPVLRTSLGRDTRVSGKLSFSVPTRIEGQLRGEVRATELLVVGEDAVVEGTVRAPQVVVLGEVRGEVRGAQRVEICNGGRLHGTVETQSLVVRAGGCLDGDCRIAPPRPPLRVLRPAPAV